MARPMPDKRAELRDRDAEFRRRMESDKPVLAEMPSDPVRGASQFLRNYGHIAREYRNKASNFVNMTRRVRSLRRGGDTEESAKLASQLGDLGEHLTKAGVDTKSLISKLRK